MNCKLFYKCQVRPITITSAVAQARQIAGQNVPSDTQEVEKPRHQGKVSISIIKREEPQHSLLAQPGDGHSRHPEALSLKHNPAVFRHNRCEVSISNVHSHCGILQIINVTQHFAFNYTNNGFYNEDNIRER